MTDIYNILKDLDSPVNLYEVRIDQGYGVIRLELFIDHIDLWIGGQRVYRHSVTDEEKKYAIAAFLAERLKK